MLASKHFDITRSDDDDWFDTILDVDTELFVDPFLVFKEHAGLWANAHDLLVAHFNRAFILIAEGNLNPASPAYKKALGLLAFREPRELCLGYTEEGTRGSGSGGKLARLMALAIVAAIKRGLDHPRHFEELGILQEGIGADRISDAACTILKPKLVSYTQTVAARHGIDLASHTLYAADFDTQRQRFLRPAVELPTNPTTGDPLLFVPERFLAELPKLNADDWWTHYENERLRTDLNYEVMGKVDKPTIVATAHQHLDSLRAWTQQQEAEKGHAYDFERDPKGVVNWEQAAHEFTTSHPLTIAAPQTAEEFDAVLHRIIDKFRRFIEEQGGWYLLWDGSKDKPERAAQLVFYGIGRNYCEANNIVIDPEADFGRGPVDFKFSNGYRHRAHVEVKKLHNGKFWNGLDRQLPAYLSSDEVDNGWFLAVRYREGRQWDKRARELPQRVKRAAENHDRNLRSALVDARTPSSASTL